MTEPAGSDLAGLLSIGRDIWAGHRDDLAAIAECVSVISGDLSRQARAEREGRPVDRPAVRRELGNLILSAVRWIDDLDLDPVECIRAAIVAQERYVGGEGVSTVSR